MTEENTEAVTAIDDMLNGGSETGANASDENKAETEASNAEQNSEQDESQTEIDWKQESRKWEERAKANKEKADAADAAETKVGELEAALEEANTNHASELEKANVEVLRYKAAALHGIKDEEDIALFLTGSDEDTLNKQAQRISQHSATTPKPDPAQGKRGNAGPTSNAEAFAAALEGIN